jgi:hypothetical protein
MCDVLCVLYIFVVVSSATERLVAGPSDVQVTAVMMDDFGLFWLLIIRWC